MICHTLLLLIHMQEATFGVRGRDVCNGFMSLRRTRENIIEQKWVELHANRFLGFTDRTKFSVTSDVDLDANTT